MTAAVSLRRGDYPGEPLTHPIALTALTMLILNDHVLKEAWPGWWTGKLSDLSGLIIFPLLLQAAWELICQIRHRQWEPSFRLLAACTGATLIGFTAIQINAPSAEAVGRLLGLLQWPLPALQHLVQGTQAPPLYTTVLTPDPTDLLTLPALALSLWIGRQRTRI